jgi:pilus assembly protein FimV
VDVILDLSWSTGRLVREYTLLFDPPANKPATVASPVMDAPVPVAAPEPAPAPAPVAVDAPVPATDPVADAKRRRGAKPAPVAASQPLVAEKPVTAKAPAAPKEPVAAKEPKLEPKAEPTAQTAGGPTSIRVRGGDTLSGIAGRASKPGVSLDQMLIGLYRNNPNAFAGNNMNRLKSGAVLNVPEVDQLKSVSNDEAHQLIVAQSQDFANYRQQLAGAVSATPAQQPERKATGKVEAEVQDRKQSAAPTPDKLTLSKGGVAASSPGVEDKLAKSRAKADDSTRVAELSKNLDELRKLKAQTAPASVPVPAKPAPVPPSAPVAKPVVPAPVASVPSPAKVIPAVPTPASAVASMPAAKPVVVPAVPSAPSMPAPAASMPASAPAVVIDTASAPASEVAATSTAEQTSAASEPASSVRPALPVPPVESAPPSVMDSLNPMLLAAGGLAAALLGGGLLYMRSRRRADTGETSFLESRLQPDSFFGASGGQRVDTRDASGGPSSMSYSLSQLDAIGDVDPVAEADVYLAYGRDLQAEEILKEALRSTPDRLAVRLKLLEVYAKRRDTKGFEQLAVQMYNFTQGEGEDWTKAQEMGLSIDPENPMYQPGGRPSEAPLSVGDADNDLLGASTVPHSVMPAPSALDSVAPPVPPAPPEGTDLDLDLSAPMPLDEVTDTVSPPTTQAGDLPPLDLPDVPTTTIVAKVAEAASAIDMPTLDAAASGDGNALDFDFDDDKTVVGAPAAPAPAPAGFDLSEISLDLDAPGEAAAPAVEELAPAAMPADPMARKLELAEEFRQIGDADGARELLQEVIDSAQDGALKAKAQSMLDNLS